MATVAEVTVRTGRRSELGLLALATGVAVLSRGLVDYHADVLELGGSARTRWAGSR
ncbi:hypothetical protein GCM10025873_21360 [Demequina sediminis]|uniref:hypothetical protein n=1 Tax=Demequina sediminis TaxID=1930058 RepID=UPI002572BCE7|nr:hypothetical protein [Demequina sediminis]BDZ62345.1 hypothetical protein GCM10025873_21360 [Demequina sediminis]